MRRKHKFPKLKELKSVQLTLDLPQFKIEPGSRVLVLDSGKTGRVSHILFGYCIRFPGDKLKTIPRHLLVEIE